VHDSVAGALVGANFVIVAADGGLEASCAARGRGHHATAVPGPLRRVDRQASGAAERRGVWRRKW